MDTQDPVVKSNPVEVTIAVTKFEDVLAAGATLGRRDTGYTMKLQKDDPRARIDGDNLWIARPGAPIRFTIDALPDDREKYFPLGIAFLREGQASESDQQRLGLLNFVQSDTHAGGHSLSIMDTYGDPAQRVRYKFSVVIQRGSDGNIGIIDPGIIHDDEGDSTPNPE